MLNSDNEKEAIGFNSMCGSLIDNGSNFQFAPISDTPNNQQIAPPDFNPSQGPDSRNTPTNAQIRNRSKSRTNIPTSNPNIHIQGHTQSEYPYVSKDSPVIQQKILNQQMISHESQILALLTAI